jgi:hypothetical protein
MRENMIRSIRAVARSVSLLGLIVALIPAVAFGADVVVTDAQGNRIELRNVRLAYEHEPLSRFYAYRIGEAPPRTPLWQTIGLKVFQGDAQVMVEWGKIQKIVIRRGPDVNRIAAEVSLRVAESTAPVTVELVQPVDQLLGEALLGRYCIPLRDVASIEPLVGTVAKTPTEDFKLAGLTVTDRKGVSMDIKVAEHYESPWLSLGAGSVTIPFRRMGRVDITPGPANSPWTMAVDIDGQGKMKFPFSPTGVLNGESALGAYSISWNQIATIAPRREKASAK